MNKYFCAAPFYQIEVTPHGAARVCCKINSEDTVKDLNGKEYIVNTTSISEIWESKWMNDFRQRNITEEKRPECRQCWDDEDAGVFSFRQHQQKIKNDINNPKVVEIVLKLSNKCNCACRICNWYLSSLWQSELEKTDRFKRKDHVWFIEGGETDKANEHNWEDWKKHLRQIHHLSLYGGEPLINDEVHKILDFLIEEKLSHKVQLGLNTNGTVINERIIEKLSKFKSVDLHFSIDDLGSRYEYERWPAKSDSVFNDLRDLHDNYNIDYKKFNILLYTTISVFNVMYLDKLLEVFKTFPNFMVNIENIAHEPKILTLYNLPETVKEEIIKTIETQEWSNVRHHKFDATHYKNTIINFLQLHKSPYSNTEYIKELDKKLGIDDARRKQDWKTTFPELYQLLLK